MEELYEILKQKILAIENIIIVERLQKYYGFKLFFENGDKRSFADVSVQQNQLKIQVSSLKKIEEYFDTRKLLQQSANEDWSLGYHFFITSEDDIDYAVDLIEQSYSVVRELMRQTLYGDVTFRRKKESVTAIFKKTLNVGDINRIHYETRPTEMFSENFVSSICLHIKNLETVYVDWIDEKQPNTNKLFATKKVQILIYYGAQEGYAKDSKQEIQVIGDKGSLSKNIIFISWRVESAEFLTSIASSLKQNNEVSIKVDLADGDDHFATDENLVNSDINKISITFK